VKHSQVDYCDALLGQPMRNRLSHQMQSIPQVKKIRHYATNVKIT
jgi:hypothetical protein